MLAANSPRLLDNVIGLFEYRLPQWQRPDLLHRISYHICRRLKNTAKTVIFPRQPLGLTEIMTILMATDGNVIKNASLLDANSPNLFCYININPSQMSFLIFDKSFMHFL